MTNARFVNLKFSAWPIERSHVAQKSSGGVLFDFAARCKETQFCQSEFVRFGDGWFRQWTYQHLLFLNSMASATLSQ